MKTSLKKLTSIFLAVLLLLSVLAVGTVSAAEGEKTIKFTNNHDWAQVYVYAWNGEGQSLTGDFPGWIMDGTFIEKNPEGHDNLMLYIPGDAVGFVVSAGKDGPQTNDITNFDVEGIWVSGDKDDQGHYIAQPWSGSWGEGDNNGGDNNGGDNNGGDNNGGDNNGGDDIYEPGSNTVYLDPGTAGGSASDWYVWSYSGGASGEFIPGDDAGDGKIKFSNVSSNVIFVKTTDGAWSGRECQAAGDYVTDGQMFTIEGEPSDGDDGFGNTIVVYSGSWGEGLGGGDQDNTEPETQGQDNTEPETQGQDNTEPETQGQDNTEPETQGQDNTEPETQPQENTEPATQAEVPTLPEGQTGLAVTTQLNGQTLSTIGADKTVKVTYNLTSPELLEDGQGTLYYDSKFLTLTSVKLPGITESLTLNKGLENMAKFNFTGVDSETNSGKFNFKNGGVFLEAEFNVVEGAQGGTIVNLAIEELDALENGNEVAYFTNSVPSTAAATVILPSLQQVVVVDPSKTEETTAPATEAETQGESQTQPQTQPQTQATIATQPQTQPATQAATNPPTPSKKVKKANTIKVKAKTYKVKASKLTNKALKIKIAKLFKVSKAKGKVTYKLVKSGVTKKIRKATSYKSKKVTIKKAKKFLKKSKTYKVKFKITAKGNADFKKKTVTKVAKIKVK